MRPTSSRSSGIHPLLARQKITLSWVHTRRSISRPVFLFFQALAYLSHLSPRCGRLLVEYQGRKGSPQIAQENLQKKTTAARTTYLAPLDKQSGPADSLVIETSVQFSLFGPGVFVPCMRSPRTKWPIFLFFGVLSSERGTLYGGFCRIRI